MKKHLSLSLSVLTLALIAVAPLRTAAQSGPEADPAFLPIDRLIDLKTIRPEVSVNLPRFLLKDAVSELNGGTNDPFAAAGINVADLIKDVKLIRVVVIEGNETNRAALKAGVAALRNTLERGWTALASVPEENVGVYALGDPSGETLAGLAVLVHDGDDVVIGNVVGHVSLGKIIKLASHFDKFPKDLLKKLMGAGNEQSDKPAPASAKAGGDSKP
ncbi:MAG: DUF4252 domain-containing protein [Limisphaerales bacterium]